MRLTLLQWNVWFMETPERVIAALRTFDADVLCLQELTTRTGPGSPADLGARIASELGYEGFARVAQSWDEEGGTRTIGNGIFSRRPLLETGEVFMRERNAGVPDYDTEGRLYLEATLDLPSGPFAVGTAHLSYSRDFVDTPRKDSEVARLLEQLARHRGRFFFSGDLNLLPDSAGVGKIGSLLAHCGPALELPTWTTKPYSHGGILSDGLHSRLDYAFATRDVRVAGARILETDVSDHLPFLVEVEV